MDLSFCPPRVVKNDKNRGKWERLLELSLTLGNSAAYQWECQILSVQLLAVRSQRPTFGPQEALTRATAIKLSQVRRGRSLLWMPTTRVAGRLPVISWRELQDVIDRGRNEGTLRDATPPPERLTIPIQSSIKLESSNYEKQTGGLISGFGDIWL